MKKKGIKKEHLLLAGAGGLALIYLLSKGDTSAPMRLGGAGMPDAPGLETITTETITIPAGGEEVGGSILLPPPDVGRFFDAPAWIKPDGGEAPGIVTPPKKVKLTPSDITKIGEMGKEYRKEKGIAPTAPFPISDVYAPGEIVIGGKEWQATLAKTKKEKIIEKPVSLFERIPGEGFGAGFSRMKTFLGETFF